MRTLFAIFCTAVTAIAADTGKEAPRPLPRSEGGVGRFVPDLAFTDLNGKAGTLGDFGKQKYLVVAVTSSSCPLSKKFAPTLAKLEEEYGKKDVAFLFVNATKTDKPASAFKGPYVHDADGKLAAALGFTSTSEVVVLDAARTVVYRGAVDDQYGLGYSLDAPKHLYLKPTLDALLAGKPPEVAATTAPGCALDLRKPEAAAVTYHNRISRIVQQNCQECHRPDGVGPFALESYDEVVSHKAMIRKVVEAGTMPPWFAAEPKAKDQPHFLNDRSLSASDKADLLAWLKSDLALGNATDAPLPKMWPTEWLIGKPDAVFQIGKPTEIKATGTMPYQNVTVETNFDEDRWVQAFEVRPTNKAVVHHVLIHVVPKTGIGRLLPGARATTIAASADDERQGYFAAYVPGNSSLVLEAGHARKLPKGATLRFQIHYTPNGEATTDQTRVGFIFAKDPPRFEVKVGAVAQPRISIPPGEGNHKEVGKLRVPTDIVLRSAVPHMHVRGKACKYEITSPDGKTTTTLLDIPRYDFNWQLRYQFAEPVAVAKGSTITFTVWFDNSDKNPANPDPTKTVKWGPQTSDEMHLGYLEYIVDRQSPSAGTTTLHEKPTIPKEGLPIPERFKMLLDKYDTNNDGKLDEKEIDAMPGPLKERVWDFIRSNGN
ncbi:redoxin family protein [Limnoglobus roseus]|uniref:Alkyl hydroperoxide reductase n=1 Tax=Limnoglobus roseus TaxID=2598579 RepID=A0A5C1AKD0_9BACT|nr:redoxin family protein [Limnoglobus roseus]QEL19115.1 alkyl hydroperoxide reductase [Limnoglobus roseus]